VTGRWLRLRPEAGSERPSDQLKLKSAIAGYDSPMIFCTLEIFRSECGPHSLNPRRELKSDPGVSEKAEVTQPRLFALYPNSTQPLACLWGSRSRVSVFLRETPAKSTHHPK
jgi:hypothetical protein